MATLQSDRWIGAVREAEALAASGTAPEVLERVVAACGKLAPRGALFLLRQGELRGWGSWGFDRSLTEAQRAFRAPLGQYPWLVRLAEQDAMEMRTLEVVLPNFGQPAAGDAAGICLRVKGRPLAFVFVERAASDEPWMVEALGLMITVARLRLELDVALRQPREAGDTVGQAATPQSAQPGAQSAVRRANVAGSPTAAAVNGPATFPPSMAADASGRSPLVETTALAEVSEPAPSASPELAAARRFARLVATDIRLYNEDAVLTGRRNRDLLDRLGDQIDRGKDAFLRRHAGLGSSGIELLRDAYVQVLAGGDTSLFPAGCLE